MRHAQNLLVQWNSSPGLFPGLCCPLVVLPCSWCPCLAPYVGGMMEAVCRWCGSWGPAVPLWSAETNSVNELFNRSEFISVEYVTSWISGWAFQLLFFKISSHICVHGDMRGFWLVDLGLEALSRDTMPFLCHGVGIAAPKKKIRMKMMDGECNGMESY